jgi:RHS repeat-associated protein
LSGNVTGDGTRSFVYNDKGRLVSVTEGANTTTYGLNGLGQRVSKAGPLVSSTLNHYVYDENGRLVGDYASTGTVRREYVYLDDLPVLTLFRSGDEALVDNNTAGQTTIQGSWGTETSPLGFWGSNYRKKAAGTGSGTFTWTPAQITTGTYALFARWPAASDQASNSTYTVHHTGGSTAITVDQRKDGGVWYPLGNFSLAQDQIPPHRVVLTDSANGAVVADAIKFAPVDTNYQTVRWIHTDHLNTPLRVLTSGEVATWLWDPTPFGENPADTDPDGNGLTFEQNVRFEGQHWDSETGLHYNYWRDCYIPEIGRYCQFDPIGLRGGINGYSYVDNDPLSLVDPYGLAGCEKDDRDCLQEALNSYSLERSVNEIAGFGAGSALFGGGLQALNKTAVKPRGGIAGGGPSGRYTSYSRRYLGDIGRKLGRASVSAAAKVTGLLGAGVQAYTLHYEALQIYLDCLEERKR